MQFLGLKILSAAALAASLVVSPAIAGEHKKAPKTAKQCTKWAKKGWKWEDGKCVKGDTPAAKEAKKDAKAATPAVEPEAANAAAEEGALEE